MATNRRGIIKPNVSKFEEAIIWYKIIRRHCSNKQVPIGVIIEMVREIVK